MRTASVATMDTVGAGAAIGASDISEEVAWEAWLVGTVAVGPARDFTIQTIRRRTSAKTTAMPPLKTSAGSIAGPFGRFSRGRWKRACCVVRGVGSLACG